MIAFIYWIMGSLFLFFTHSFARNNNLSDKATAILFIIVAAMIIIVKNALGID